MTNAKFLLLASISFVLSGNIQASEVKGLTFTSPGLFQATTRLSSHELSPLSALDNAVKLANVRFITQIGDSSRGLNSSDIDTKLDAANQCVADGFTLTSCPENSSPDESTRCPLDKSYFKECACDTSYYSVTDANLLSTCGNKAQTTSCSDKSGTHHVCHCNEALLTQCSLPDEYISEQDYKTNVLNGTNFCRDSRSLTYYYPKTLCKSCKYPYVINSSKNNCSCSSEFKECDLGPEVGANSCTENGITKHDNCKACPHRGTYTTCPRGYACSFEDCSDKYYITGCASGYTDFENCSWKCKFSKIMPKN